MFKFIPSLFSSKLQLNKEEKMCQSKKKKEDEQQKQQEEPRIDNNLNPSALTRSRVDPEGRPINVNIDQALSTLRISSSVPVQEPLSQSTGDSNSSTNAVNKELDVSNLFPSVPFEHPLEIPSFNSLPEANPDLWEKEKENDEGQSSESSFSSDENPTTNAQQPQPNQSQNQSPNHQQKERTNEGEKQNQQQDGAGRGRGRKRGGKNRNRNNQYQNEKFYDNQRGNRSQNPNGNRDTNQRGNRSGNQYENPNRSRNVNSNRNPNDNRPEKYDNQNRNRNENPRFPHPRARSESASSSASNFSPQQFPGNSKPAASFWDVVHTRIDLGLKNYRKNLFDYTGTDDAVLRRHHETCKGLEMNAMESWKEVKSVKVRGEALYKLDMKIDEAFGFFLNQLRDRQQRQFQFQGPGNAPSSGSGGGRGNHNNYNNNSNSNNNNNFQRHIEDALSLYRQNMDKVFRSGSGSSSSTFIEKCDLLRLHHREKDCALALLQSSIPQPGKDRDKILSDFNSSVENTFEKLQLQNDLRLADFKLKVQSALSLTKNNYSSRLKSIIDSAETEGELARKNIIIRRETLQILSQHTIPNSPTSREFVQNLQEELKDHMDKSYEDQLNLFQFKQEEDELAVKSALLEARTYYNEEMDKHFNSKDFMQPSVLDLLHKKIMGKSIRLCKDKEIPLSADQEEKLKGAMKVVYLKYKEKNALRLPMDSPAIGIDLGTTNSCVAIYLNGQVKIIDNENGNPTTPSYVSFQEDGSVLVGDTAHDQSYRNPENTIFDAKRLIGRKFDDPKVQQDIKVWPFTVVDEGVDNTPKIKVRGATYHPEEISAHILRKMKKIAEDYLGKSVKDAVITVPALFNDGQRQATKDAGRIAGLNVLKIINEPTAAAIGYQLHRTDYLKRNVLIFDLGGGTFDISILQMVNGEIDVKAVHGDTHLGGEDFDGEMVKYCIEKFKGQHGLDLGKGKTNSSSSYLPSFFSSKEKYEVSSRIRRMRNECERQKRVLSSGTSAEVCLEMIHTASGKNLDLEVPFTRSLFELLNEERFQDCIKILKEALKEAGMVKSDIDDIVLVGGSTKIPKVQKLLQDFFDGKALTKTIHVDVAVAHGAAIQACLLSGQKVKKFGHVLKIRDVTPMSLGVEVLDKSLSVIIPKNTTVPCSLSHPYAKVHDEQSSITVSVYEGEQMKIAKLNNLLGEFKLNGIPTGYLSAHREKLDIKMTITDEGILNVKATVRSNQQENEITVITKKKRLTETQIVSASHRITSPRKLRSF